MVPGSTLIGGADPHLQIEVTVKLRRKQPLPGLPERPSSPITREQLAEDYGAAREDIDAVIQTYTQIGLTSTYTDAATRTLKFSGTVAEMEKAFRVRLFDYSHPEGNYRGREGDIYVPTQLSTIVEAVFGLDNRRVARPR
jgi:kumamolisin